MISEEHIFEKRRFFLAIAQTLIVIGLLWLVFIANQVFMLNLNDYGLRPRELSGLAGIFTLPFLHADYEHLFSNTLPLFFLLFGLFYFFQGKGWLILLMHYLISGILTWVIATMGVHIGASGLVYGLAFFMVTISILKMEEHLMAYTLIIIFLYGSIVWGFFPSLFPDKFISWEGHLAGAITGVILAFFYRHEGPTKREYVWEDDEDEDNDIDFEDAENPLNSEL